MNIPLVARVRGGLLAAACAFSMIVWATSPAFVRADSGDPLFVFYASSQREGTNGIYPSPGGFNGPCGLAADPTGALYVSDHYRNVVDVFKPTLDFLTAAGPIDPLDGPCGLALDSAGRLYVNDFHRSVLRYAPSSYPLGAASTYGSPATIAEGKPTGVAVDRATGRVYVDERTYIAVFDPTGAPVLDGEGHPLRLGDGSLEDGYGVAVSAFGSTAGYVYVPDAAARTVKVYDPAGDPAQPVAAIDGHEVPGGAFVSLRDSAIAVDPTTGYVYVADDLQPEFSERPEAAIYAFRSDGSYAGRLKHNVIDARPPGLTLAPDGSRVYVTSGNSTDASIYAYTAGELVQGGGLPAAEALAARGGGAGAITQVKSSGQAGDSPVSRRDGVGSSGDQKGNLRLSLEGQIAPQALPRVGRAPVAVTLGGHISTTDGSQPPQLKSIRIELNRGGHLESRGLPICPPGRIRIASSARALAACRAALVGSGHFEADIALAGQQPYPTEGRLLAFNGRLGGRPAIFAHIYSPRPFATSFVIVFTVSKGGHGRFGTVLSASLPRALGNWGYLTGIEMKLSRHYAYRGSRHSFISAGCPAPKGFPGAVFTLARATFSFTGGPSLGSSLTRSCRVRGG